MKTATGLTLIAIGAVFAFAVHGHPWFLNLQVCGWIIMAVGVAGLAVPRRGYGWLRRQVVMRRGPESARVVGVRTRHNPSYIMLDPAAAEDEPDIGGESAPIPGVAEHVEPKEWVDTAAAPVTRTIPPASAPPTTSSVPASGVARSWPDSERVVPDEETVEEFFQE
jgi:hypothetical protein